MEEKLHVAAEKLRVVFMGTPEFAVASLDALLGAGCNVVGVVTMPDKPVGRHHETLQASAVKQYAVEHGLPVLQPEKLRDEEFLSALRQWNADLQVVVAFRMLPEVVWDMPRLGTFNLHAALLPQYRGAAPINWAIINGETETGVTTFFLDHDIDTGRIILQERCPIAETDNAETIHDRLMEMGARAVVETVQRIADGRADSVAQETLVGDASLKPAPKIFRETCQIRWQELGAKQAYDFVRGLSPYPAAWATLCTADGHEAQLKVFRASFRLAATDVPAGTLHTDGKATLEVALRDGWLSLQEVQLAGKKRMPVEEFLRGAKLQNAHLA